MAASVVPSRARAGGRLPEPSPGPTPTPSSPTQEPYHVRLILQTDSLRGPALSSSETYVIRWQRGTRQVKTSRPASISATGNYTAKLSLYVTVRRAGPAFIADNPADPLDSTIQLLQSPDAAPIAETRIDVPGFLQALVQAGRKSLPLSLALAPAVDLGATLTFNTIGGSSLTPYTEPGRPAPMLAGMPPHSALALSDPSEAAAAAELERLRADVREKEGRIDKLADSTDKLDRAVQEQARLANGAVPAGDVAALHVRIKYLEEEKASVEREKEEVEKKVAAHVAHAQKIRNTYNQLAGWYNNLRKSTRLNSSHVL